MALTLWEISGIILVLACAVAAGAYFFSKTRVEPAGIVRANDFTDEKLRMAVIRAVKGVDVAAPDREKAERLIEELARHAAGKEYANIYPGLKVEVTEHWPDARCIITGNIAVIDIWVGHGIIGHGDGIRPIQVEINRQPALKLETRRPIKAAFDELHELPPKVAKTATDTTAKPARPSRKATIHGNGKR
jgi:hypothetical protein